MKDSQSTLCKKTLLKNDILLERITKNEILKGFLEKKRMIILIVFEQ